MVIKIQIPGSTSKYSESWSGLDATDAGGLWTMLRAGIRSWVPFQSQNAMAVRSLGMSGGQSGIPDSDQGLCELDCGLCYSLSCVQLFATPRTVARLASLSMDLSRQEYWNGLPFPSPEELPNPGIGPWSPVSQADSLPFEPQGSRDQGSLRTKPPNSHQPCRECAGCILWSSSPNSSHPPPGLATHSTQNPPTSYPRGAPPTPSATP